MGADAAAMEEDDNEEVEEDIMVEEDAEGDDKEEEDSGSLDAAVGIVADKGAVTLRRENGLRPLCASSRTSGAGSTSSWRHMYLHTAGGGEEGEKTINISVTPEHVFLMHVLSYQ